MTTSYGAAADEGIVSNAITQHWSTTVLEIGKAEERSKQQICGF